MMKPGVPTSHAKVIAGKCTLNPAERVRELRRQIAEGTYLTTDKLEAAIGGLHADLFGNVRAITRRRAAV